MLQLGILWSGTRTGTARNQIQQLGSKTGVQGEFWNQNLKEPGPAFNPRTFTTWTTKKITVLSPVTNGLGNQCALSCSVIKLLRVYKLAACCRISAYCSQFIGDEILLSAWPFVPFAQHPPPTYITSQKNFHWNTTAIFSSLNFI